MGLFLVGNDGDHHFLRGEEWSEFQGEYGLNLDVSVIKAFNESPHARSHLKSIKRRGHPLSSMVIDNSRFCSMVWIQGTLYLSHPWYFTTHGFDPSYFPKEHCNNVVKQLYAFSIKHLRIQGFSTSYIFLSLLIYWVTCSDFLFLVWFERWGSKNPLWASPLHVTYLLYVTLCIQGITC